MRLKDLEGEQALIVLADLLEPCQDILSDSEVTKVIRSNVPVMKWVEVILKRKPKSVIKILAILDGEDPNTYKVNILTLPRKLIDLFNDPDVMNLFQLQGQPTENASSGSVQENIEA